MKRMTQPGPEALLVMQRTGPRSGISEYARLDYPRGDQLSAAAAIGRELEYLPVKRSRAQRLIRWGRAWLRRDALRAPVLVAVRSKELEIPRGRGAAARPMSAASLAELPAVRAGVRAEAEPRPISALPVFGQA